MPAALLSPTISLPTANLSGRPSVPRNSDSVRSGGYTVGAYPTAEQSIYRYTRVTRPAAGGVVVVVVVVVVVGAHKPMICFDLHCLRTTSDDLYMQLLTNSNLYLKLFAAAKTATTPKIVIPRLRLADSGHHHHHHHHLHRCDHHNNNLQARPQTYTFQHSLLYSCPRSQTSPFYSRRTGAPSSPSRQYI